MEIVGYDPYYVSGKATSISAYSDLGEMLSLCDYVTLPSSGKRLHKRNDERRALQCHERRDGVSS